MQYDGWYQQTRQDESVVASLVTVTITVTAFAGGALLANLVSVVLLIGDTLMSRR